MQVNDLLRMELMVWNEVLIFLEIWNFRSSLQ